MQNADTPEHALGLLDRAVLLRLDPDPDVGFRVNPETGEPIVVGPRQVNPESYLILLRCFEQADSVLDLLSWSRACSNPHAGCPVPHWPFAHFRTALRWAGLCSRDRRESDLVEALDRLIDSEVFDAVHGALAEVIRRNSAATCGGVIADLND